VPPTVHGQFKAAITHVVLLTPVVGVAAVTLGVEDAVVPVPVVPVPTAVWLPLTNDDAAVSVPTDDLLALTSDDTVVALTVVLPALRADVVCLIAGVVGAGCMVTGVDFAVVSVTEVVNELAFDVALVVVGGGGGGGVLLGGEGVGDGGTLGDGDDDAP